MSTPSDAAQDVYAELEGEWRRLLIDEANAEASCVRRWSETYGALVESQRFLRETGRWVRGPSDIMGVLRLQRDEVRNCRLLRWLLDPLSPHGMGTQFLRAFLARVATLSSELVTFPRAETATVVIEETRTDPHSGQLARADLLIYGPGTPNPEWTVLIEAKIDAGEQYDQGARLQGAWESDEPTRVFLTTSGARMVTGDENWLPVRWVDVANDLRSALRDSDSTAPGHAVAVEYLRSLETHLP